MSRADRSLPAAVLWDFDGTLVDTEPFWFEAEGDLVRAHGGTWGQEQAEAQVGSNLPGTARALQAAESTSPRTRSWITRTRSVASRLDHEIPGDPGRGSCWGSGCVTTTCAAHWSQRPTR